MSKRKKGRKKSEKTGKTLDRQKDEETSSLEELRRMKTIIRSSFNKINLGFNMMRKKTEMSNEEEEKIIRGRIFSFHTLHKLIETWLYHPHKSCYFRLMLMEELVRSGIYFKYLLSSLIEGGNRNNGIVCKIFNLLIFDYHVIRYISINKNLKNRSMVVLNECRKKDIHREFVEVFSILLDLFDPSNLHPHCASCRRKNAKKVCSVCRRTRYCSVECQRIDWRTHRKECKLYIQEEKAHEFISEGKESHRTMHRTSHNWLSRKEYAFDQRVLDCISQFFAKKIFEKMYSCGLEPCESLVWVSFFTYPIKIYVVRMDEFETSNVPQQICDLIHFPLNDIGTLSMLSEMKLGKEHFIKIIKTYKKGLEYKKGQKMVTVYHFNPHEVKFSSTPKVLLSEYEKFKTLKIMIENKKKEINEFLGDLVRKKMNRKTR